MMRLKTAIFSLAVALAGISTAARADNQTPTTSPIAVGSGNLPYDIRLRRVDTHRTLPTLQAFASGILGGIFSETGLWVIIGGRTNGLHNFSTDPLENFPPSAQNRRIWIIDPTSWKVWSRSIKNSRLSVDQVDQLSASAYEHVQLGDVLYVIGGYGYS